MIFIYSARLLNKYILVVFNARDFYLFTINASEGDKNNNKNSLPRNGANRYEGKGATDLWDTSGGVHRFDQCGAGPVNRLISFRFADMTVIGKSTTEPGHPWTIISESGGHFCWGSVANYAFQ